MSQTPTASGGQWSRDYQHLTLYRESRANTQVPEAHKHLSPDRWSPTGWKYVPTEAISTAYLAHPNKRNAYPERKKPERIWPEKQRLMTSSRLHYARYTPDLYVKTEEEEGEREEIPPLPISQEKLEKEVGRLPRAARRRLAGYEGYHEPTHNHYRLTATPSPRPSNCWAGLHLSPETKAYHKRKTPLTEWMEHAIVFRKDRNLR